MASIRFKCEMLLGLQTKFGLCSISVNYFDLFNHTQVLPFFLTTSSVLNSAHLSRDTNGMSQYH